MLWQGAPDWWSLAVRSFHWRKVAIYFAALMVWDVGSVLYRGQAIEEAASLLNLAGLAAVALGLIALFCYLVTRTTVYTVTSQRVVIRAGIALPKTINIPYVRIASAGVKLHTDGTGDLLITPVSEDRIAYFLLWPHAQALQLANARPMLRSVPEAAKVARILGDAMAAGGEGMAIQTSSRAAGRRPASGHAPAAA
jgi:hypothetical protein